MSRDAIETNRISPRCRRGLTIIVSIGDSWKIPYSGR
jgi:hypothetical protein